MTITNQTNPIGTTYTSKKIGVIVPQQGITENFETIYTSVRLTKSGNDPVKYTREIVQYPNATSGSSTVIAKEKVDPETGKGTNEFEFNLGVDYKGTEKDTFKKLVQRKGLIKTQTKDAEKNISDKTKADLKNKASDNKDDSVNSSPLSDPNRSGIARQNYGVMQYPAFVEVTGQDHLKITILEFSSRFRGGKLPKGKLKSQLRSKNQIPPPPKKKSGNAGRNYNRDLKAYYKKYPNADNRVSVGSGEESRLSLDRRNRIEANKRTVGHIVLPIPDGVSDQNKVNFSNGTLNAVQVAGAEAALKLMLKGRKEAGSTAASAFEQAVTDPNVREAISNLVTGSVFNINANELLARTQGNVLNNNLELLFSGPTLRPFNFSFNLSARSGDESRNIKKIIRAFKQSSAAQRTPGGLFLAAPNTFKLEFINGKTKKTHQFLPRMKECALLGVNVNYMPENTYMTYDDTSMVSYKMDLSFREIEPIFNDDYDQVDVDAVGFGQGRGPLSMGSMQDAGGIGF